MPQGGLAMDNQEAQHSKPLDEKLQSGELGVDRHEFDKAKALKVTDKPEEDDLA